MLEISDRIFRNVIAPLIAAQFFFIVLIYFTTVRKRITSEYKLYICFLATFILYLVGRPFQLGSDVLLKYIILYTRLALLYAIGMPSLLMAVLRHSGYPLRRKGMSWIYGTAALCACVCFIFADASMGQFLFNKDLLRNLGLPPVPHTSSYPRLFVELTFLVLPCSYLLVKELRGQRRPALSAFLFGSLILGLLMIIGPIFYKIWIVYVGSIFSAICWGWAIHHNLRDMTTRSDQLKNELQQLVQSGQKNTAPDIDKLLTELEQISAGNPAVYKMRVHEVLSRLTDVTIEAGGDSTALIHRHEAHTQALEKSENAAAMREIACTEAAELSDLIAELPLKNQAIKRAETYIQENYGADLSVEDIAQAVGLSRSHFMREFKKGTGQTANQYLTAVRLERAQILLLEKSVTETAFAVGYNDSNYFGAVFKKQFGQTPSQFKNNRATSSASSAPA